MAGFSNRLQRVAQITKKNACPSENSRRDALYFPANRDLAKKDLILRAVFKPMDTEDHSAVGGSWFPMTLPDALDR